MIVQNINGKRYIYLLCNKVEQPIGTLYTSSLDGKILKKIAFSNPRVLVGLSDDGEEIYRGIQRALAPNRVEEIKKYVNEFEYATFPSSIILNLPHEKVEIREIELNIRFITTTHNKLKNDALDQQIIEDYPNMVMLVFPFEESVAQIIDGQHRMAGITEAGIEPFNLPITIFIDQLVEQQAEIFSVINGKQTRVTPSLVYELFGINERPSPYKTAHNVMKVLNNSKDSPIKGWIKRLGKSNNYYEGYITQSTLNQNILKLISGNAKQVDEDMRTMSREEKLKIETPYSRAGAPLRIFFIEGDESAIIKILFNYFSAIKNTFPDEWNKSDSIFKRTIGFTALFKVLTDLIPIGLSRKTLSEEFFASILKGIKIDSNVTLSSKGINELYSQFESSYSTKFK